MNKSFKLFSLLITLQILLALPLTAAYAGNPNCDQVTTSPLSSNPGKRFRQAYCNFQKGSYDRTIKTLNNLERSLPVLDDYIIFFRASALAKSGKSAEAIKQFKKIIKDHNSSVLYKNALEEIAGLYDKSGNYETAISKYNQLVAMEDSSWLKSRYINRIAEIYLKTERVAQAAEIYKEIWTKYPQTNYSDKIFELSDSFGVTFTPGAKDRKKRADVLFELGLREEALSEYLRLPRTDDINTKIAICLYYTDRQKQALDILNRTNSAEADFWRGKILEKNGLIEDALRSYYSSYVFFPSNDYAQKGLMKAAELNKSRGEYAQALEKYRLLLTKNPDSRYARDASWNIGWIHYLRGDYQKSLKRFSGGSYPENSLNSQRFLYWKAKSLEKLGNKEDAYEIYRSIAHSERYTYHAFLSRLKIGHKPREPIVKTTGRAFSQTASRRKLKLLMDLGFSEFARLETERLKDEAGSVDEAIYLSSVYYRLGDYYSSVAAVESRREPETLFYSFPKAYRQQVELFTKKYSLNDLIVYSLIREESRFDRKAVSGSDARGLMQLLPSTALETAQQAGVNPFTLEMLYQPEVNVELGTFYLRKLLNRFNGNIPLALAGYNAGPNRIAALLEDIEFRGFDEFVEKIPIFETKDYVKKILRSYGAYRAIYGYE